MTADLSRTDRTRLRRSHERGHFDRETLYGILDAMPLCHVGYNIDGKPVVMPTCQWRQGDHVYWHGSSASRGLRAAEKMDVCLTVTLMDGLVLARSGMHHSANFRSAMIYGVARKIEDTDEKVASLEAFVEGLTPGRWDTLHPINAQEIKATTLLSMPIDEASAKIRTGGPKDDEEDYALPIWAGVVPITMTIGEPEADPRNLPGLEVPADAKAVKIG